MLPDLARSYTSLGRAILRCPKAPWEDALSHGQLQSKAWAIGELGRLRRNFGLVYILGGWLGTLGMLMFEAPLRFRKIRSFDIDPSCEPIADQVNIEHVITDWRFKAVTLDMFKVSTTAARSSLQEIRAPNRTMPEQSGHCDTVINTCCDHIKEIPALVDVDPGRQAGRAPEQLTSPADDHVNTVKSPDAIITAQAPMRKVLPYKGSDAVQLNTIASW